MSCRHHHGSSWSYISSMKRRCPGCGRIEHKVVISSREKGRKTHWYASDPIGLVKEGRRGKR